MKKIILLLALCCLITNVGFSQKWDWLDGTDSNDPEGDSSHNYEDIEIDDNGTYAVGWGHDKIEVDDFEYDAQFGNSYGFIFKFSNDVGALQWGSIISCPGSGDVNIRAIAVADDGSLYVTGIYYEAASVSFGETKQGVEISLAKIGVEGVPNSFVAKYDTDGFVVWAKANGSESSNDIVVDSGNGVYTIGQFNTQATFGNIVVQADEETQGPGNFYIAKFDKNTGNTVWVKNAVTGTQVRPTNIQCSEGSNIIYVGGDFENVAKATVRTNPDPQNNITQLIKLTSAGGKDSFISRFTTNGELHWLRKLAGGTGNDYVEDMSVAPHGYVYVCGSIFGQQGNVTVGKYTQVDMSQANAMLYTTRVSTVGYSVKTITISDEIHANHPRHAIECDEAGRVFTGYTIKPNGSTNQTAELIVHNYLLEDELWFTSNLKGQEKSEVRAINSLNHQTIVFTGMYQEKFFLGDEMTDEGFEQTTTMDGGPIGGWVAMLQSDRLPLPTIIGGTYLFVYPNPTSPEHFGFDILSPAQGRIYVNLIDEKSGRSVYTNALEVVEGENTFNIRTKDQLFGVYVLNIKTSFGETLTQRVIVE